MRLRLTIAGGRRKRALRDWLILAVWVLGGGGLVLSVFALSFYLSIQSAMRSNEVEVPDLQGLDLESAAGRAEPLGLVLDVVDQRHNPTIASGRVIEQMPRAGLSVRRGRKVKLVLSLGGEVLEVPDLLGQAARAVEIELRQVGFIPGEVARVPTRDAAPGTIIAQVPPPQTPAVRHTRVHRLVAEGPPQAVWVMPDLTGLRREQAERWIGRSGFRRGTVRRVRMVDWPPDTVVGQLPLAGYPIRKKDIVELTVAQ